MAFWIITTKFVIIPKIQFLTSLYSLINSYTRRFPFPHRGWKYVKRFLIKRNLLNKTYLKKLHNGFYFQVNPSEHIQEQLFWYGYYEKDAILTWERLIQPGFIVADIGANTGYYSVIAAKKANQVYAFEPSVAMQTAIAANSRLNNLSNVQSIACALGNEDRIAELFISDSQNTGMSSLATPENFAGKAETVQLRRFDTWGREQKLQALHLVKIDTEGAEMEVLQGMKESLVRFRPVFFVEIVDALLEKFGANKEAIFRFFSNHHYHAYQIKAPGTLIRICEPQESWSLIFIPAESRSLHDVEIRNT